jgi:FkbM family methyltransferase
MPWLAELRAFVTRSPSLRAIVAVFAWPLVWWRRRIVRRRLELYEQAVAFPAYGEVAVPVAGVEGTFLVDIRSDILQRVVFSGGYEPQAVAIVRRELPSRGDAIDAGANIGIFSVLLATLAGDRRVLAIEPTPAVVRRLRHNLLTNGVASHVIVEECAIGSESRSVTVNTVAGMEEYSRVGSLVLPNTKGKASSSVTVPMHTLDELVTRHGLKPTFMKMDIEGSEMQALRGATATLHRHRPTILAEVDDTMLSSAGSSAAEVLGFLRSHGYAIKSVDGATIDADVGFNGDVLAVHIDGPAVE